MAIISYMLDFLKRIVREAGDAAIPFFLGGVDATSKTHRLDLLTEADLATSHFLVEAIQHEFPTHHIHSEELAADINSGAEFEWVIDPIDGTWNFKNKVPLWAVMVSVLQNGVPKYAVVYYPMMNEMYTAERGKGAEINSVPLQMSGFDKLSGAAGEMYVQPLAPLADTYRRLWQRINEHEGHLANYGSMYGAAQTVRGMSDFYLNNDGRDHDYLPFVLFASEAGGCVSDSRGEPWQRGRRDIVIANPTLHSLLIELLTL